MFQLLSYAACLGISFALSPAITDLATDKILSKIKFLGASSVSVSLDGASEKTHDSIRKKEGTFERTEKTIQSAVRMGLNPQINTIIMKRNYQELPQIFHLIGSTGVKTWELFFLVKVGRGADVEELSPEQYESVCNFLYDALFYGVTIRCVEAPFIRRVVTQRGKDGRYWDHAEYEQLRAQLLESEGQSQKLESTTIRPSGTLDGDGILFVVYDGTIHLGGLLPFKLGNVKNDQLIEVYRNNDLLRKIRQRDFQRLLRRM